MNFKALIYCAVFLSLSVFSNANCSGDRTRRETAVEEVPADTGVATKARETREYNSYGEYSDTKVDEQEYGDEYGDEYEADNSMDYYEDDTQGDPLDENTIEDYGYQDEMPEGSIDYYGEDYYDYDEGDYEDSDEDNTDYEYNAIDWGDNDSSRRDMEYDEYESDAGQTAEDLELWYRRRRATENDALVCDTEKERDVVRRISSLQETLTVMQKQLNYERNKCQSKSTYSVTNPTTTTHHPKQHKKVDDLPVCEV